ncbi:MAG: ATP-binding cassette domain-containing protein [Planctomycetes bacterium]|nr:ATP-binding cassette domain-containing protein [Planctomycetota bacterium]
MSPAVAAGSGPEAGPGSRQGPDVVLAGVAVRIGDRQLLADLDLQIPAGQHIALIGPSGAGKTTLLRLLAGIVWPTAGTVQVLGRTTGALRGRALAALRREVGFLRQHDNLVPGLRVAHNVLMGRLGHWSLLRSLWSLLWPQQLDRAHAALQRVELGDRLWALPGELSGGEQQRVAIARLLLQEPRLLLADEPASSLDIRLGHAVVRLLLDVAAAARTTIVSLHSLELLALGFDRVLALRGGRLAYDGPVTGVTRELLRLVYGTEYRALHLDELDLRAGPR